MSEIDWVVLKFGGTSVQNSACWVNILNIAKLRLKQGYKPVIVCSAITSISNQLEKLIELSIHGEHGNLLKQIQYRHLQLLQDLELKNIDIISPELELLNRLTKGLSLIGHSIPKISASIMALGELMLSKIGAAWLNEQAMATEWLDAREFLKCEDNSFENSVSHFLSARIKPQFDFEFTQNLISRSANIYITQGFIASDYKNQTVLLGRGGSDTSASLFGAKLSAKKVEIWTDVPGMFTTNPMEVDEAMLIKQLDYDEAQELATSGAKVLHPRCIEPLRKQGIPLHIGWTQFPDFEGTQISASTENTKAQVKAVLSRTNLKLITLEGLGMWQEVGFLADIFAIFKKYKLSIDLIATSQIHVSLTLDPISHTIDNELFSSCLKELSEKCSVKVYENCAAVSLVGKNIRSILHTLGSAFSVFEEKRIFLVSQAASDLNFTFVVEHYQASKLVRQLHNQFFSSKSIEFGPLWRELFPFGQFPSSSPSQSILPWWVNKRQALLDKASSTPLYIYDRTTLEERASELLSIDAVAKVHYAVKANPFSEIIRLFGHMGLSFDCVSFAEIEHVLSVCPKLKPHQILFTPNFAPRIEYEKALSAGTLVTLDNIFPLEEYPQLFRNKDILLRIDPGMGKGHHKFVRTGGFESKFGITIKQLEMIRSIVDQFQINVIGLHVHVGSGIEQSDFWIENAKFLADIAENWPSVTCLDIGGGLRVPEKIGDSRPDILKIKQNLTKFKEAYPRFDLWIEPGRYLVAEAGVLLARMTQSKTKGQHNFIGLETGMNSLIRPPLYGAYHEIVNLSRYEQKKEVIADIVGPICESADILGYARSLPLSKEGDLFCIANTGAYGRAMASHYNLRSPAQEMFID